MIHIRFLVLGFLALLLAACTVIPPEGQFRLPAGTGSSMDTGSDVVGANEAMPKTTDSLEVGAGSSAAPIEIHATSGTLLMGDLKAPVTLTIFDDYGCFYCREFGLTDLPWVLQTYVAQKKMNVERIFAPQSPAGEMMTKLAICSAHQNLFLETDKALHANPISTDAQTAALAKTLKLNLKTLQTCMASTATKSTLQFMIDLADGGKIERRPAFELQNDRWIGVVTRDELKKKIDAAL
jgi:protein-disulfide isomerase